MAQVHKMRWTEEDNERLYKIVDKFNKKRDYHFKKKPKARPYLPERVSIKDIREDVYSRKDFDRIMKSLDRFGRRGAEEIVSTKGGAVVTKWEKRESSIAIGALNRRNTWKAKKLGIDPKAGNLTAAENLNLKPYPVEDLKKKSTEEFKKYLEGVEKRLKSDYLIQGYENYKENYLQGIYSQLGGNDELIDIVESTDPEELFIRTAGDPDARIDFMYEPQEIQTKIKFIKKALA